MNMFLGLTRGGLSVINPKRVIQTDFVKKKFDVPSIERELQTA